MIKQYYKLTIFCFLLLSSIWSNKVYSQATVDLTTLNSSVTNAPGGGSSITWHSSSPVSNANKIIDPTSVTPGVAYYMAYYDAVLDCYSPGVKVPTLFNSCPDTTINLTVLDTEPINIPSNANAEVTWHTASPATNANKIANPSAVAPGIYYMAYYDAVLDCYSPASPVITTNSYDCTITGEVACLEDEFSVYLHYPAGPNNTNAARYKIISSEPTFFVTVDQTNQNNSAFTALDDLNRAQEWVPLGHNLGFDVNGNITVRLEENASPTSSGMWINADAIMFVDQFGKRTIIDNNDATQSGTWNSGASNAAAYNNGYRFIQTGTAGTNIFTWAINESEVTHSDDDQDGVPDGCDLDDDNDGILDIAECTTNDVTNGEFTGSLSGWTATGNWFNRGGVDAYVNSNAAVSSDLSQSITMNAYEGVMTYDLLAFDGYPNDAFLEIHIGGVHINTFSAAEIVAGATAQGTSYYRVQTAIRADSCGGTTEIIFRAIVEAGTGSADDVGVDNVFVGSCDADGDCIANHLEVDSDNDGCPDAIEALGSTYTLLDIDGGLGVDLDIHPVDDDGVPANSTNVGSGSSTDDQIQPLTCDQCDPSNVLYVDTDGDGVGNACDADDDNDGIEDCDERFTGGVVFTNPLGVDEHFFPNSYNTYTGSVVNAQNLLNGTILSDPGGSGNFGLATNNATGGGYSFVGNHPISQLEILPYTQNLAGIFSVNDIITFDADVPITIENPVGDLEVYIDGTQNTAPIITTREPITIIPSMNFGISPAPDYKLTMYEVREFSIYLASSAGTYPNGATFRMDADCLLLDTDGDGIPDNIDTDADGDGCPDALESTGSPYTWADLNPDGSINTTLHPVGPNGYNGGNNYGEGTSKIDSIQSVECDACNDSSTLFSDNDLDGIGDECDLDDDNDGVLDADECEPLLASITTGNGSQSLAGTYENISGTSMDFDLATDYNTSIHSANVTSGLMVKWDQDANVLADITLTLEEPVLGVLESITIASGAPGNTYGAANASKEIIMTWPGGGTAILNDPLGEISSHSNNAIITSGTTITLNSGSQVFDSEWTLEIDLSSVTTFPIDIVCESDASINTGGIQFESFAFIAKVICDFDNDGIPNYLDTDSDNDGCPDALESASSPYSSTDLNTDGSINTTTYPVEETDTATLGVPSGTSYGVGTSQANVQLTLDPIADQLDVNQGTTVTFTANASGTTVTDFTTNPITTAAVPASEIMYQWYISTDNGVTFTAMTGETNNTLTLANVTPSNDAIYKVEITHVSNSCVEEETAELTVLPCDLFSSTLTSTSQDEQTCDPAGDGSITLENGGIKPNTSYTVSYDKDGTPVTVTITSNASSQIIIPNLEDAVYTNIVVSSTTLSNCSATLGDATPSSITLLPLASNLNISVDPTNATSGANPSCSDGSATSMVTGGTEPYSYLWDNSSTLDSAVGLTGSLAGVTHTVTVTDANGCTATESFIIGCDNDCDANVEVDTTIATLCVGDANGGATVTASSVANPNATFTFTWSNSQVDAGVTTSTVTGLSAGVYTVSVTIDGLTCQAVEQTVTVTEPASALEANVTGTDETALNADDGTATATPSGGTSGYTYQWDAAAGSATTQTVTGLEPGTYCVIVTDANGCTAQGCYEVVDYECSGTVPQVNSTIEDVSCNGLSDGEIILNVTNPTNVIMPLSYSWTGSASTTNTASGLAAGNYSVTITGADGCFTTLNPITVGEPSELSAGASVAHVKCNGESTGSIDVTVIGGTMPYIYAWSDDTSIIIEDRTGLAAGTYSVTVTDSNECTDVVNVTITEPTNALNVSVDPTNATSGANPSCSDGSATSMVTGGTEPYSYLWDNSSTLDSAVGLTGSIAGVTHTVTVTDANGCTATESFIIGCDNDCDANVEVDTTIATLCVGDANGGATVTASSVANPNATFTFTWSNSQVDAGVTTSTVTGLSAGVYTVSVTIDGLTCQAVEQTVTVTEPASALEANVTGTDETALNADDGTATATPSGGTSGYTYQWDAAAGSATTQTVTGLEPGTYCVIVTDANGCTAQGCYEVVDYGCSGTVPQVNSTIEDVSCNGLSDGEIILNVTNPTNVIMPLSYSWTGSASTTNTASGLAAGNYSVTITGADGCFTTLNPITVGEPSELSAGASVAHVKCNGESTGSIDVTVIGGTMPYIYAWSDDTSIIIEDRTGLAAGTYSVTVTDSNECTDVVNVTITEPTNALNVSVDPTNATSGANPSCSDGSATSMVTGGTEPYSYLWDNSSTLDSAVGLTGSIAGVTHTVTVTDANGCTATESFIIGCDNDCDANVEVDTTIATLCVGDANGGATVTASSVANPNATFTFTWSNSQVDAGVTTSTVTGLSAGVYTVSVTIDGLTCQAVEQTVTVTEPASALEANVTGTDETALNADDGTATATPSGGTSGYTYQWDAAAGSATTQTVTGLEPGTYCVIVTDANGCTAQGCYEVVDYGCSGTVPQVNSTIEDVSCNGLSDGEIILNVTNPTNVIMPLSYSWTGSASTTNTASGLAAGNYSVTITGADGCFTTLNPITVGEPSELSAGASVAHVKCNGESTGSIDVTVIGGTMPYIYAWSDDTSIIIEDRTGLAAGTYSVTVTDSNECTDVVNVTITEPTNALNVSVDPTNATSGANPSCSDGSATSMVTGGTEPYSYLWDNSSTLDSAVGLTGSLAGVTHTVTVTDANGCTATESFIIGCDNDCDANVEVDTTIATLCVGDANGGATVTASSVANPNATFTFTWSNSQVDAGVTTSTVTGLSAGVYTVSVTIDGLTCQAVEQTVTVTEPASALEANVTGTDETALNADDGTATATPSGGTSGYTYQWDAAAGSATTQTVTGLEPGTYCVIVTDANGCTAQGCYEVVDYECSGTVPQVNSTIEDVSCNGLSDGEIILNVTNPTNVIMPLSYSWTGSASTTNTASGLAAGNYSVTITGADGCFTTLNPITVGEPSELSAGASVAHVKCNGESTGSIDVTVIGGTMPYIYAWSDDTSIIIEDRTGLAAGTYSVTVTDSNECTDVVNVTITEPTNALNVSVDPTNATSGANPSCSDGSATSMVTGGTEPYSYLWDNSSTLDSAVGLTGSLAGVTHTVTVTDANGCTATESFIIGCDNDCDANVEVDTTIATLCVGDANGGATVTASSVANPNATFTFTWSNSQVDAGVTTSTVTGLSAGVYTVSVTIDGLTCQAVEQTVTVTEPASALEANVTGTDETALNADDGTATATPSGGTSGYTYQWDAAADSATTQTVTGLEPGTYCVIVTDANGCTAQGCYEVVDYGCSGTVPQVNSTIEDVSCNGLSDGEIILNVTNPTNVIMPLSYSWTGDTSTTNTASDLSAGNYSVTITGADGCFTTINPIIVTEPGELSAGASVSHVKCNGESTGSIDVTVTGGIPPYDYAWSDDTSIIIEDRTGLAAGTYSVTVTDSNECTDVVNVTITEPTNVLVVTIDVDSASSSMNCMDGSAISTVTGGTEPYSYLWSNNVSTVDSAVGLTGSIIGTTHSLTVTDANGCTATESFVVYCAANCDDTIGFTNVVMTDCFDDSNGSSATAVAGSLTNPNTTYTYSWTGPNGYSSSSATISDIPAGDYTVTATPDNSCVAIQATVTIEEPTEITALSNTINMTAVGSDDGQIELCVNGGTPGYAVSIFPFPSSSSVNSGTHTCPLGAQAFLIDSLPVDDYTITITDTNGCSVNISDSIVNVDCNDFMISTAIQTGFITCNGLDEADITVTLSDNSVTPSGPYTYMITGDTSITSSPTTDLSYIFENIGMGTYNISVVNSLLCVVNYSTPIIITEPDALELVLSGSVIDESCSGNDGQIPVVLQSTGTADYIYSLLDADNANALVQNSGTVSGTSHTFMSLEAGNYNIVVEDNNGCVDTLYNNVISQDSSGADTISSVINVIDPTTCTGADGEFTLTSFSAGNYTGQYTLAGVGVVNFGPIIVGINGELIISGLDNGSYSDIIVITPNGCQNNPFAGPIVLDDPTPVLGSVSDNDTICLGETFTLTAGVFSSGVEVEWHYDSPTGQIIDPTNNPAFTQDITPSIGGECRTYFAVFSEVSVGCTYIDSVIICVDGPVESSDDGCFDLQEDMVYSSTFTSTISGNDDTSVVLSGGIVYSLININNGSVVFDENADTFTYTPPTNFIGSDTAWFEICNAMCNTLCDTSFVCFNVTPVIDTLPIVTCEDCPITVCVPEITNPFDSTSTITGCDSSELYSPNGTVTADSSTGCITYTPNPNYVGEDSTCIVICNADGVCDTTIIPITVTPVIDTLPIVTCEDCPITVCVPEITNPFDSTSTITGCDSSELYSPNGTVTTDSMGCITYTPNPNYVGEDSTCIVICNADGVCDTTIIPITVTPVIDTLPIVTCEDCPITVCVPEITNPFDSTSTITGCDSSELYSPNGTVTADSSTGCITYTPNPNYVGEDSTCIVICNADGVCDTTIIPITVTPVIDTLPIVTCEDCPITVCVPEITNPFDSTSTITGCDSSELYSPNGTVTADSSTGCITYTPNPNYVGEDSTCIVICNADGVCDTTIIPITVTPVIDTLPIVTCEDCPITVCVPEITNPFDSTSTITGCDSSELYSPNGTVTADSSTGCITYTPNPNYVGEDSTCIVICNADGVCDTTIIPITVTPVIDTLPIVTCEDCPITVCVPEITNPFDSTSTITGCDSSELYSPNGTVTTDSMGCITYTPNPNYVGEDSTCIVICNADGVCDTTIIPITVTPVIDTLPIVTCEDCPITVCVPEITNPFDSTSTITGCDSSELYSPNGTVTADSSTGCITYTPNPNYVGEDSTCIVICNADGVCDTTIIPITVTPVIDTLPIVTCEDCPITVCVPEITNPFDSTSTITGCDSSELYSPNGTVTTDSMGCITYTPNPNYVGEDSTCIVICNADGVCDTTIIPITVTPVIDTLPIVTCEDCPITVCVPEITNPFDSTSTITGCDSSELYSPNGTVTTDSMGCITYTPNPNYVGEDSTCIVICNADGVCDTTIIPITVTPVIDTLPIVTCEDCPITVCVPEITNPFDSTSTITGCDSSELYSPNGTVTTDSMGCITYTPNPNYVGEDSTCIVICNADGVCDTTIIPITVTPVIDTLPIVTCEDCPITVCVPEITNPFDSTSTITGCDSSELYSPNGTVTTDSMGCITYTPNPNYVGEDSTCIVICNADGVCDTTIIPITVTPVIDTLPIVTCEDCPITVCVPEITNPFDSTSTITGCDSSELYSPNGTVTADSSTGCITYTPNPNYVGEDSTCIVICNADGVCDTTIIPITVTPVIDTLPIVTCEDCPITVCVPEITNPFDSTSTITGCDSSELYSPNGTVTADSSTGCITYTPNPNYVGEDSTCIVICNADGVCDTTIIPITVTPVIDTLPIVTCEDCPITVCVPEITNPFDSTSTITGCDSSELYSPNGTVTADSSTGCITYTPNPNYVGEDSTCIVICNADGVCDTTIIPITVTPVIDTLPIVTCEDCPITVCVPEIPNPFDSTSTITGCDSSELYSPNGTVTTDSMGCITYTPNPNYVGEDSTCIVICNADGVCDTTIIPITVTPVIDTLPIVTCEDCPITVCVPEITNPFDSTSTITGCDSSELYSPNGTVTTDSMGCITYTPNPNYVGEDSTCIVICNADGVCDTTIIPITVTPVIDTLPIVTCEDCPITVCVPEITNPFDSTSTITGCDSSELYSPNGTVTTDSMGCITYTPNPNYVGEDSTCIVICNADGVCDTTIIPITVTPVNKAPHAINDINVTFVDEEVYGDVSTNDSDFENGNLTFSGPEDGPSNGTLVMNPDGTYTYTPDFGFEGDDEFTYVVCDDFGLCDTATVVINVIPITEENDPPTAINDNVETTENTAITSNLLSNDFDVDGDVITVNTSPVTGPSNGVVVINPDGTYTYTPDPGFTGEDQFTYEICDEDGLCDVATVTIYINPNNVYTINEPIAVDDVYNGESGSPIVGNIGENDYDFDGDMLTYSGPLNGPSNGTVTVNSDGTITYISNTDYYGPDNFTYIVCDELGSCDTATVYITVAEVEIPELMIPQIITPNGDGDNDNFEIIGLLDFYPNAKINIYNRWGDEVWNSGGSYQGNWHGNNFSDKNLPDGTYFYLLNLSGSDKKPVSGFITVYRNQ